MNRQVELFTNFISIIHSSSWQLQDNWKPPYWPSDHQIWTVSQYVRQFSLIEQVIPRDGGSSLLCVLDCCRFHIFFLSGCVDWSGRWTTFLRNMVERYPFHAIGRVILVDYCENTFVRLYTCHDWTVSSCFVVCSFVDGVEDVINGTVVDSNVDFCSCLPFGRGLWSVGW